MPEWAFRVYKYRRYDLGRWGNKSVSWDIAADQVCASVACRLKREVYNYTGLSMLLEITYYFEEHLGEPSELIFIGQ